METILSRANSELHVGYTMNRAKFIYQASPWFYYMEAYSFGYSVNWSFGLPQKDVEIEDVVTAILGLEAMRQPWTQAIAIV